MLIVHIAKKKKKHRQGCLKHVMGTVALKKELRESAVCCDVLSLFFAHSHWRFSCPRHVTCWDRRTDSWWRNARQRENTSLRQHRWKEVEWPLPSTWLSYLFTDSSFAAIFSTRQCRAFSSYLTSAPISKRFQSSFPLHKTFDMKMSWFSLKRTCRRNTFSYKWFRTKTRFDTEEKANSELPIKLWKTARKTSTILTKNYL